MSYNPDAPWCGEPLEPECLELCLPRVPNGCDCFGCCVVDGQNVFLGLQIHDPNGGCSAADLDQCNSCTIVPECFNPCESEACELCLLDAPEDLAPGCTEPSCPDGVDSCMGPFDCGEGQHCSGGCCLDYGSL